MENVCPICKTSYAGSTCPSCTGTGGDITAIDVQNTDAPGATAFLVDLVSNRKIPITTPRCKVGRDDLNDIVISGDQSISRFHFVITKENGQYHAQDGKSRHGTFLNGNQITGPEPIHDGDVLKVGVSLFWFVIEAQVVAPGNDKTSPVDIENETELEFVSGDNVLPSPIGASEPHSPLAETIAPKGPEWERQLNGATSADAEHTPKPEELAESEFEITGAIPTDGLEARLTAAAAAEAAATQTGEHSTSNIFEEIEPEPAQAVKEDSTNTSAEPATSDTDTKESTESAEEPNKKDTVESVVAESNDENQPKLSEDSPETTEADELPEVTASDDSAIIAEHINESSSEEPSLKETEQTENEFASHLLPEPEMDMDMESQFRLSEDEITKAANRLANDYASAVAENSAKAEEQLQETDLDAESNSESVNELIEAESKPQDTLDKLAEAVGEAESEAESEDHLSEQSDTSLSQYLSAPQEAESVAEKVVAEKVGKDKRSYSSKESKISPDKYLEGSTGNGAKGMSIVKESASSATVPDWCKRYFSSELNHLDKELTELNEEVRQLQTKIKDVESRTSLTKGLRNILLTTTGDDLVDACGKIFAMMGWRVRVSDDDKMELKMESDDKSVSIARVVWTEKEPDRSHLGQLSISQTRYWCEVGVEPKGILIIARSGDHSSLPLAGEYAHELADYASKKNVCLMSTLQLLSCYKEVFLHDGSPESVRSTIQATSGWLHGFHLEPGTGPEPGDREPSTSSGKASLSSLLSA